MIYDGIEQTETKENEMERNKLNKKNEGRGQQCKRKAE